MWHFRTWFSRHGGVGQMVGLDLRGFFEPLILWFLHLSHKCTRIPSVLLASLPGKSRQTTGSSLVYNQQKLCKCFGYVMLAFCKTIQVYVFSISKLVLYLYATNKISKNVYVPVNTTTDSCVLVEMDWYVVMCQTVLLLRCSQQYCLNIGSKMHKFSPRTLAFSCGGFCNLF